MWDVVGVAVLCGDVVGVALLCGMWWEWQCCVGRGGRGTAVVGVALLWWEWHCCVGSGGNGTD